MQCTFTSQDDKQCAAHAISDGKYCFFHNPDAQKQRLEAQSKGGKANAVVVKNPLQPLAIKEVKDVVKLLEETINLVRAGNLDVRIGNCIGVLSGHIIKALEVANISSRVEIIERAILEKRTRS